MRDNTERPVTVEIGTNVLVGNDAKKLNAELARILGGTAKKGAVPSLWDGNAGERIAQFIFGEAATIAPHLPQAS